MLTQKVANRWLLWIILYHQSSDLSIIRFMSPAVCVLMNSPMWGMTHWTCSILELPQPLILDSCEIESITWHRTLFHDTDTQCNTITLIPISKSLLLPNNENKTNFNEDKLDWYPIIDTTKQQWLRPSSVQWLNTVFSVNYKKLTFATFIQ